VYEYEPGEAMGQAWPTPLIQITATSEEQTDNIYDALRPMIELGPLRT
jgi:putative lipoic acid-binding regulatory protein